VLVLVVVLVAPQVVVETVEQTAVWPDLVVQQVVVLWEPESVELSLTHPVKVD
jgi:hypothetical protein